MPTTRRTFLAASTAAAAAPGATTTLDSLRIAARHAIVRDIPTPNFFEGMLLGNGDLGVCVTVRPDAIGFHLGKNDAWDIRVSEDHAAAVLPFAKVLEMWDRASERAKPGAIYLETSDPELRAYYDKVRSSYDKPWPRPWPCGTVWMHWDPRRVSVIKQTLDITNGLFTLDLDIAGASAARIEALVLRNDNHLLVTAQGAPITSLAYQPHIESKAPLPDPRLTAASGAFTCFQSFPATPPPSRPSPNDSSFTLAARVSGNWNPSLDEARHRVVLNGPSPSSFRLDLSLATPLDAAAGDLSATPADELKKSSARAWREFWSKSAVEFGDLELERIWYHNQYWLACCLKPGAVAPGLFGNWSRGSIGTAWHGDYHMNYNTQQVYWGVFSSNHVEQHLPFIDLVEKLMPMAEWNAREQFSLEGAYFPHSAYPVPSKVNPYPVPPWGYEICETPWTVQSLWWHYLYTRDAAILKRVYPPLRAAAVFIAAYMKKEGDGRYHANPSVSPENWGLTAGRRLNRDCIIDIALIEFLLDAVVEASKTLEVDGPLRARWREIRDNIAAYPTITGPQGEVWGDVAGAPPEWVYNVPVTTSPVFPGEQVGLDRKPELLELARRTIANVRLEGGNDLVWQPLVRARLGMLDVAWFKREVRYCTLPNGIANDRVRQIGGRYTDQTDPDFMMRMGVWTENLSLPAVLNECMLQSHAGIIRLFPNTKNLGRARFHQLRAAGAFLVSAEWDGRTARNIQILSEKGGPVRLAFNGRTATFETRPGGLYQINAAGNATLIGGA